MKTRLTWAFISVASGSVGIAIFFLIIEIRYHIFLYLKEVPQVDSTLSNLLFHLQQALTQSALWTAIGSILIAIIISFYIAKRISAPLIEMKEVAEEITRGNWNSHVVVEGNDELSELGHALNHLTKELQKQEDLRKNLTSDIAHELRTPLSTLKSHMEAFEDGIWEPTPDRIHSCYEEIERLIHLVGDLEQLTELESPGFQLDRKEENVVEIVEQCTKAMETAYLFKEVYLLNFAKGDIFISVDKLRMKQILMNLLSNALKYTPSGGKVIVKVIEENEQVLLIVKDTGMGIPKDEVSKVFERFYRVDKSRSRTSGGSGIGLTIAKKLVEAHEGSIWIESEIAKGTTVYIAFPKR